MSPYIMRIFVKVLVNNRYKLLSKDHIYVPSSSCIYTKHVKFSKFTYYHFNFLMEQLLTQLRILRKMVTKTQQHIFKIQYPSTGNKGSPQQHMTIYV